MNFVIFMPDELMAETVGCYGHPLVKTPNIDRLAAEGTRFDACYVQHPVCTPSRISMFTGQYPHVSGHRTLWHLLRPHEPNFLRDMTNAGYEVHWFGKNDLLAAECFADCTQEAIGSRLRSVGPLKRTGPEDKWYDSFLAEPFGGGPWETGDGQCVGRGIEFLKSKPANPFVLYLPLILPHPDYSAPMPWHEMYSPADVPDLRPPGLPDKPIFYEQIRRRRGLDRLSDDDLKLINSIYLGTTSYSDWLLGQLLDTLDETALADDTCVIFTSDHGDWAGEYGLVEKWPSAMDDTILRVPLVIRMPGGKAGYVVDTPVELFDFAATMMDLAGVEAGHTHFAQSLVPQLKGVPGDADRAAFAEGGYARHEPHCFEGKGLGQQAGRGPDMIYYQKGQLQQDIPESVCRATMVRTAAHKLVHRTDDICELYDMAADPRELTNLYGRPEVSDIQAQLERRLLDFYSRTSDVTPADEDPRGMPKGGFRKDG